MLIVKTPSQSLTPAVLKIKPSREQFEQFKAKLAELVAQINASPNESEEHHKNHISDFLKYAFHFPAYFINTSERIDLAVHNGKSSSDSVGVILEVKRASNQAEMPTLENLNVRAMQELVLYYLRERLRIMGKNYSVKHLIITNGYEWFVFDAQVFEKAFADNTALVKKFNEFEAGRLSGSTTDFFYKEIAKPAIEKMGDVEFTHFDLRDKRSDKQSIALFKIFSPEHLLKLPFANDSNSLNKDFYSELLHIIGLVEVKDGSKKLIQRKKEGERNRASLLENAISKMDAQDKLRNFENPKVYGDTPQEQLFNVGLELAITWVNRVLFLKLLEAQLSTYHKGDISYNFLNIQRIRSFDDLDDLFFKVLARQPAAREAEIQKTFAKVPYLNSSLFETTEIERKVLTISNLSGEITLPIFGSTVLKAGKDKRRKGELNTLEYLFAFLDSYDFTSEGADELKDDSKTLINASVLGLIFEKINGYKDGSFFTPGFITMYMCREALRRAVVQKFNDVKGWTCKDIAELDDKIEAGVEARTEANQILNSLKICDPAVGSGHFLVSALNELIAIKSELGILQDSDGKRLKNYAITVVHDELMVRDEDGDEFAYSPTNVESARIQKTLFLEKQTLIENCLFGVDINPNSVKICRLRLWIELLKNAYYNADGQLETLPNIDINIKVGNSLISRFALDVDLKEALKKNKLSVVEYRQAVQTYRNATSKEQKFEMERLIADIKNNFRSEMVYHDPKAKRLENLRVECRALELPQTLLEETAKDKKERLLKLAKLKTQFDKLDTEIEEIKSNKIYQNAFEWRFEFPEVLDDDGVFVGFDVVIGNPPYIQIKEILEPERRFYEAQYKFALGRFNLFYLFMERCEVLVKTNGYADLIIPDRILLNTQCKEIREWLIKENTLCEFVSFGEQVFEAVVDSIILLFKRQGGSTDGVLVKRKVTEVGIQQIASIKIPIPYFELSPSLQFDLNYSEEKHALLKKIASSCVYLGDISDTKDGIIQGKVEDKLFLTSSLDKDSKPLLFGSNVRRYSITSSNEWVNYKPQEMMELETKRRGADVRPGLWMRTPSIFERPKILTRQTADEIIATYDDENYYYANTLHGTTVTNENYHPNYVLGILNSKVITWFYRASTDEDGKVFAQIKIEILRKLPVPKANAKEQKIFVARIGSILAIKKQNPSTDTSALEKEIDQLVYALYDLTPAEIAIVEGKAAQGADPA